MYVARCAIHHLFRFKEKKPPPALSFALFRLNSLRMDSSTAHPIPKLWNKNEINKQEKRNLNVQNVEFVYVFQHKRTKRTAITAETQLLRVAINI